MRPTLVLFPLSLASAAWSVPVCSGSPGSFVATTWYASWHAQYLAVSDISWSKYTSVSYSFGYVLLLVLRTHPLMSTIPIDSPLRMLVLSHWKTQISSCFLNSSRQLIPVSVLGHASQDYLNLTDGTTQSVKALLTIGGWTGSKYFSSAVATPENRTAFADAVMGLVNQYGLDGVDFE